MYESGSFYNPTFSTGQAVIRWPDPRLAECEAALAEHLKHRIDTDPKKAWDNPVNEAARRWREGKRRLEEAVNAARAIQPLWEAQR